MIMKTAINRLAQLGFSEYEARAYIALLKEHPLTAYEIAKNSGIPTSKIYEVIKKLELKQTVQPIHGERSKVYIPASLDEFVQNFRSSMEDTLHSLKSELQGIRTGMDTSYTWHIRDYDGLILKAKRMFSTAQDTVLLLTWPMELKVLLDPIREAEQRQIKTAVIHYGATNIKIKQLYIHPIEDTIFAERNVRGFTLVADSREALIGQVTGKETEAIWSMNEGFVIMSENYIRHEIYQMKTMKRLDPLMRQKFGERYEKLRDIFNDDEQ
jgi:sugar-specific transcriptional regulator TrmB